MRILINTPDTARLAGVANFYRVLRPVFSDDIVYFTIHVSFPNILKPFALAYDLLCFCIQMIFGKIDAVILNPSLGKGAVVRDGLYAWVAKNIFKKSFYVHWHGWQKVYEKVIDTGRDRFFIRAFFQSDGMFVLANSFKETLVRWGYDPDKIHLTTTVIEDSVTETNRIYREKESWTVTFLARLVKEKGILTAIDTQEILEKHKNLPARLLVAGNGPDFKSSQEYALSKDLKNIEFLGYVQGNAKADAFLNGDIYIFPSSHGEGMPTSLLEAMGYGLPVITSRVGGIPDFFENGKMGFMIDSADPKDYAEAIETLVSDPELAERMGRYNRQYASEHFTASKVAANLLHYISDSDRRKPV